MTLATPVSPASPATGEIAVVAPAVNVQRPVQDLTWENIVQDHSARVYRLAYHLTGNKHDAEDLTQDVFVRVFNSLSQFKPGTFEGWLHRITTNLFLDRVRRKKRIRFDWMGDDDATIGTSESFDRHERSGQPEDAFDMTNLSHDVVAALADLKPDYRAAVVLSDIEGLSYEEIAATLGIKMGTVRSRLFRARAKLRESLAHRAPGMATDDLVAGDGLT